MSFNHNKNTEHFFEEFSRFRFSSFASRSTISEERGTPLLDINFDFNRLKSATKCDSKNESSENGNSSPEMEFYKRSLYELMGPRAEEFLNPKNLQEKNAKSLSTKLSSKSLSEFRSAEDYWNFLRAESERKLIDKFGRKEEIPSENLLEMTNAYVPSLLQTHITRQQAVCDIILDTNPIRHCGQDVTKNLYARYFIT